MAKTKTIRVTDEELAALTVLRQNAKAGDESPTEVSESDGITLDAQQALVNALAEAITRTQPKRKVTIADRKEKTPWSPPEGVERVKLRRKMFHHGLLIEKVNNSDLELLNKIKPGIYCEGWVRVILRKDRGLDIDYPVRTNQQRLKLINQFGVRSFTELLERIIDEKENPKKYRRPEDADLFDLE